MSENDPRRDTLAGKTVGHFVIQEEIGRGGMATVYSAKQTSMGRTVAVKVLPPHFLHDPDFLERFEREVEVISQLEHPHILPIYDYGEADGIPYIAMRYLGGGSMADLIRRTTPDLEDIVKPLQQVAEALDHAHQQGVIHRDLKPGNIMLDESGNAYLSDFGIARVMGSDLTGSAIIGTPAYMSPEQAQGMNIDGRSDIYALGIVLFELITGTEPYAAETPMSLLLKHITEALPPMSRFREGVPYEVEEVIKRATTKDPQDRYPSAGVMAAAFADAVRHSDITDLSPVDDAARDNDPSRTITDNITPLPNQGGTLVDNDGALTPDRMSIGELMEQTPSDTDDNTADDADDADAAVEVIDRTDRDAQQSSQPSVVWAVAALVVVVILGGGAWLLSDELSGSAAAAALPTPTPFADAVRIDHPEYSFSVPAQMLPNREDYYDLSSSDGLLHAWQSNNGTYIVLRMIKADRYTTEQYIREFYEDQRNLRLIDREVAPDGTVRQSYRAIMPRNLDVAVLEQLPVSLPSFADRDAGERMETLGIDRPVFDDDNDDMLPDDDPEDDEAEDEDESDNLRRDDDDDDDERRLNVQRGQLDIFVMVRDDELAALEFFTPDRAAANNADELVATLQQVLDSLVIKPPVD